MTNLLFIIGVAAAAYLITCFGAAFLLVTHDEWLHRRREETPVEAQREG